ncbi:MAG: tetratricopeptide (TPR) repeat protein [Mariniblastus sp.]|jgi:tetratricopeptide (TPR) repeat protein
MGAYPTHESSSQRKIMAKQKLSLEAQAIVSALDAGHLTTTVALVESFLVNHPESQRAWLDLGQSLAQLARYDEAETAFKKVIELAGETASGAVYGEIGNIYRAKSEIATAIQWYQKQIDTDPADATGLLYLGNVLMRQGKFEEAKKAFVSALQCELVCIEEVEFSLGLICRNMGRLHDAKNHFDNAIELDDKFTEAKTALKDVVAAANLLERLEA